MTAPDRAAPDVAELVTTFRTLLALADAYGWGTPANASVVEAMRLVKGYGYQALDADIEQLAREGT